MIQGRLAVALMAIPLLMAGCGTSLQVVEPGHYSLTAYEMQEAGKAVAATDTINLAGLQLVTEADHSLIAVFASGRREAVGTARAPGAQAPAPGMSGMIDVWVMLASLPDRLRPLVAALAADIRRRQDPYTTDASRAAWAMLAADHVPVSGQLGEWRFRGWVRLRDEDWRRLRDAVTVGNE